jgi:predicted kinase
VPGRLVLLCGRSFSGKSELARALTDVLPGTAISLDAINHERDLHGGQGIPVEEWVRTHELARERVTAALFRDDTVIVDDTSSPRFLRDAWRSLAADHDAGFVLVFLDAAEETLRVRRAANRARPRRPDVTDAVMSEHLSAFEPPGADEEPVRVVAEDVSLAQVVVAVTDAMSFPDRRPDQEQYC